METAVEGHRLAGVEGGRDLKQNRKQSEAQNIPSRHKHSSRTRSEPGLNQDPVGFVSESYDFSSATHVPNYSQTVRLVVPTQGSHVTFPSQNNVVSDYSEST